MMQGIEIAWTNGRPRFCPRCVVGSDARASRFPMGHEGREAAMSRMRFASTFLHACGFEGCNGLPDELGRLARKTHTHGIMRFECTARRVRPAKREIVTEGNWFDEWSWI